jgi:hypothetical protein
MSESSFRHAQRIVKATIFSLRDGELVATVSGAPARPFEEFDGKPLELVTRVDVHSVDAVEIQFVEIKAGGHFVMHLSPAIASARSPTAGEARPARRNRARVFGAGTLRVPAGHAPPRLARHRAGRAPFRVPGRGVSAAEHAHTNGGPTSVNRTTACVLVFTEVGRAEAIGHSRVIFSSASASASA